MTLSEIAGLFVIPALVGAVSGWIYWRAAGRPHTKAGARQERE